MNYFAKNILFLRKTEKLTQAEMPDLVGIGRATWSNYENSETEPDIEGLIRISEFFGVDIASLLLVDLKDNVHLIQKKAIQLYKEKGTPKREPNSTPNYIFSLAEDEVPLVKKEIDSSILAQLKLLTDEVIRIRRKLDK